MLENHITNAASKWLAATALILAGFSSQAADEGHDFFEKKIRPLLIKRCYECHSHEEGKSKGGLTLDTRHGWMTGGDSGPALAPGDTEASLLLRGVSYQDPDFQMPPKGKLTPAEIKVLNEWVAMGAPDPRDAKVTVTKAAPLVDASDWWSFQAPVDHPLPQVLDADWARAELDRFILAKLEEKSLTPAPPADRTTLIRRAYFDLLGLPPAPAEIDQFVNDDDPNAFRKVVDHLLASPHFGERWGRHWLDIARFAESSGGGRALIFPNAWRYRDYVVRALNQDKPYDRFIKEQIAGDLLPADTLEAQRDAVVATGFLLLGPINYELQDKELLRMEVVDEQLTTLGQTFLGMTIGCARCHDHKFDAISMKDYYSMAGIMRSTKSLTPGNVSGWEKRFLPVPPEVERAYDEHEKAVAELEGEIRGRKSRVAKLTGQKAKLEGPESSASPASGNAITVDDTEAEISGEWLESTSIKGYVGSRYLHDGASNKGAMAVKYTADIPVAGIYKIRVSYTAGSNRANNTPVTIACTGDAQTILVNQKEKPPIDGQWFELGQFHFAKGRTGVVTVSNEGTSATVIADAVQFIPIAETLEPKPRPNVAANIHPAGEVDRPEMLPFIVGNPSALPGIVIDNTEARVIGQWQHSTHTPPHVGASYIHDQKEGKGGKSVIYETQLPMSGRYEVRMSHCYNVRRATNTPVTILHADGETTVRVNQQEEPPHARLFRTLGEFRFAAGQTASVTISNEGTDGKYVIADAVQFIPLEDVDAEQERLARIARLDDEIKLASRQLADFETELKKLKKQAPPDRESAMAVRDADDAGDYFIAIRGDVHKLGDPVPRGFISAAQDGFPEIAENESGRRQLAEWLASPDNPLTARLMVNRVWHHLFGAGIVRTTDNFGATGEKPSHPELLDWLTHRFIEDGWSTKKLIRRLMLSRTYMASTEDVSLSRSEDPENRLFWRMHRKRLEAEVLRDSMLAVSGELDRALGGNTVPEGLRSEFGFEFKGTRRSLYSPVFRNNLEDIFEVFDFANPNLVEGKRANSTLPTQALYLMNSPFVRERAKATADQVLAMKELSTEDRIHEAYQLALGRMPSAEELDLAKSFLQDDGGEPTPERWTDLCQSLFACLDFRYVR